MEIIIYAFTVMYTPGPVNLIGMNAGFTDTLKKTWGFFLGVGIAMFIWFLVIGLAGQYFISATFIPYIALAGSIYTLYLAYKIGSSSVSESDIEDAKSDKSLSLANGFFLQALNPKNSLVVVPITTVMFPAVGILGSKLVFVSFLIALGGGLAPASYFAIGRLIGNNISAPKYFKASNIVMSILLVIVAFFMFYDYFWKVLVNG